MSVLKQSTWRLTSHARERMARRLVGPLELSGLLDQPARRVVVQEERGGRRTGRHLLRLWGFGIGALVDPRRRIVLTVLIDGAPEDDRDGVDFTARLRLDDLTPLDLTPLDLAPKLAPSAGRRPARSPVHARHALEDVDPALRDAVWRACGGDVSRVTIHGPRNVEIA